MKATYRRDNLALRRKLAMGAALVVCLLVLISGPVRDVFSRVVYTTAPRLWDFGISAGGRWNVFWGEFHAKAALVEENRLLREEIDRMQVQVLDRNLLEERVAELEGMLGRVHTDDRVAARVLAGPGRSPYDTLVIDAGEDAGVHIGDRVAYVDAGVIGEVVEVYADAAKVKLFSSPGTETAVIVGGVPATALGRGLGNFIAKLPIKSTVVSGEQVLLEGSDLVVGVVGSVEEKPAEPFVRVYFRTTFNISGIRSVEVIKGKTPQEKIQGKTLEKHS